MVCKAFYASEYIQDCNISKLGEGCEKCVPLFNSSWKSVLLVILIIAIVLIVLGLLIPYAQIENNKNGRHKETTNT